MAKPNTNTLTANEDSICDVLLKSSFRNDIAGPRTELDRGVRKVMAETPPNIDHFRLSVKFLDTLAVKKQAQLRVC
jgi:hypothetical protein